MTGPSQSASGYGCTGIGSPVHTCPITVGAGAGRALFTVGWENGNLDVSLIKPDLTVITPQNAASHDVVVSETNTSLLNQVSFGVPEAAIASGLWQIQMSNVINEPAGHLPDQLPDHLHLRATAALVELELALSPWLDAGRGRHGHLGLDRLARHPAADPGHEDRALLHPHRPEAGHPDSDGRHPHSQPDSGQPGDLCLGHQRPGLGRVCRGRAHRRPQPRPTGTSSPGRPAPSSSTTPRRRRCPPSWVRSTSRTP